MSSPNLSTFDIVPPRRPGKGDFNGIAKVDDQEEPPDPTTMPNAAEWNTMQFLLLSIGRIMPVAVLTVAYSGGTPSLQSFGAAPTNLVNGSFTLTDNGTGDVSITWAANTFPVYTAQPMPTLNGGGAGMIEAATIANGVRVKTFNSAGSAADRNFTVAVY